MARIGWVMAALFALFMIVASAAPKLLGAQVALTTLQEIGWPVKYLLLIGVIELACTVLFLIPRTALLGAILMTALLGGALASHLRADSPVFSHTLFSVYLGVFMWVSLWLRDGRIRNAFRRFPTDRPTQRDAGS